MSHPGGGPSISASSGYAAKRHDGGPSLGGHEPCLHTLSRPSGLWRRIFGVAAVLPWCGSAAAREKVFTPCRGHINSSDMCGVGSTVYSILTGSDINPEWREDVCNRAPRPPCVCAVPTCLC
jgi:hypothetical protein